VSGNPDLELRNESDIGNRIVIYGRGYLGSLISSLVHDFSSLGPYPLSPDGEKVRNSHSCIAVLASGPPSVSTPKADLVLWHQRLEAWTVAHKCSFQHAIYISSAGTVYGEMKDAPHLEQNYLRPNSDYGRYHKWAEDHLTKALGDRLTIIRLANIYGPAQRVKDGQGFITAAVRAAEEDIILRLFGNGTAIRDYIHEQDVIRFLKIVINQKPGGVFNVATGVGISQMEVLEATEKVYGKKIRVEYLNPRPTDLKKNILSIKKALNVFGWSSTISLEAGIATYKEKM